MGSNRRVAGEPCRKCGKGTLGEASIYDDWEGYLTCNSCKSRVPVSEPAAPKWRYPLEPNNEGKILEVHASAERIAYILKVDPTREICSRDSPADLSRTDVKWFHVDACELYDDFEHYLQYKCLNCGTKYDIWIPDC